MMTLSSTNYRHNLINLMTRLSGRVILLAVIFSFALVQQQAHAITTDWTIKIKSSVGEYHSQITFGEFADASVGYDVKYDAPAHPAPAAIMAYFPHSEWGLNDTQFWYDIKSQGQSREWTFFTDSNLDGQELSLEWNSAVVPAEYKITLTDTSTGQSIDMKNKASYSYVSGSPRQFTITAISSDSSITETDTDGDGLLDEWELTFFTSLDSSYAEADNDNDGLSDSSEYSLGTNPNAPDSDNDGDSDYDEVQHGSNPVLGSDTIDLHRPYLPLLQQVSNDTALTGQVFDSEAFDDPDLLAGDYLSASRWQISTDQTFAESTLVLDRQLDLDSNADTNSIAHRQLLVPNGVLRKATQYWLRTKHKDSNDIWSDWSTEMSFSTVTTDPNDLLGDGIDDRYQAQAYVDTNSNGVDDNDEANIYPINTADYSASVGLSSSDGVINFLGAMDSEDIIANQLSVEAMPYHLFDFRIDGLTVDNSNPASVAITFYFPEALPAGIRWYKYDAATQAMSDYSANTVINDREVTLTLIDGGSGDADGVVNGTIIDPSGPALAATDGGNNSPQAAENRGGSGTHGPIFLILGLLALWLSLRRNNKGQPPP